MGFGDGIDWGSEARRAAGEGPPGDAPGELVRRLREALVDVERPTIVDCGCNIARFYPQCRTAGFSYTGIDQSEEALSIARGLYPGVELRHTFLWEDWPARYPAFDAAFCNAVLQHNTHDEKRRILPRIAQAVRAGGFFGMQESVVLEPTRTQLRQADWIALVEGHGFMLISTWHPNNEYGIDDAFLFRKVR